MNKLKTIIIIFLAFVGFDIGMALPLDSLQLGFSRPLEWNIGVEAGAAFVPRTNQFLKGDNPQDKIIRANFSGSVKAAFKFSPDTKEGALYEGAYQGIGLGAESFFSHSLLGTPVTAYVFQGAPIAHFSSRLWLGYEWKFGAAFGWKPYDEEVADNNSVVSTSVTAMMALALKLHYSLSEKWSMAIGVEARHFSNGNTSWPNAGINSIGATIGLSYTLNPIERNKAKYAEIERQADEGRWMYDIVAYGAWRKRVVFINQLDEAQLCPGKFGVVGLQFSPLRSLNRYVAVGPALDLQWDESAGLTPYWVEGTTNSALKFYRPPFGKQVSAGVSAHAELTMPIFAINAGLGFDIVNPKGNNRFYQSLAIKTFLTDKFFINVGYRLGKFKDPQNLMLGVGVRL